MPINNKQKAVLHIAKGKLGLTAARTIRPVAMATQQPSIAPAFFSTPTQPAARR